LFKDAEDGFTVRKYAHVPGPHPPPSDMLYVILPDLHLPGVHSDLPCCAKGMPTYYEIMKDLGLLQSFVLDKVHITEDPSTRARPATFLQKKDADIFGNAGEALIAFLLPLVAEAETGKFKVVQVGDMFELWQGMDEWGTYFEKNESGTLVFDNSVERFSVKVSDGPKSRVYQVFEQRSVDALKHRLQGILLQHWSIFHQFDQLAKYCKFIYLYGNHDVYLVDKLRSKNNEWRSMVGNLYPCKTHLFESHLAFEHGHRMDEFNQDGDWRGQFITELVFVAPFLRSLDPDRREMYHYLSAADVYYHHYFFGEPISVFVMGHTHVPDLTVIRFWRRPAKRLGYRDGSICMTCIDNKIQGR
jgi:UDP-2,3-diacylglucosamine pyrophosphatase LpxH